MKKILYAILAAVAGATIVYALYLTLGLVTTCNLAKVRSHEADLLTAYRAQRLASTHNQTTTAKR